MQDFYRDDGCRSIYDFIRVSFALEFPCYRGTPKATVVPGYSVPSFRNLTEAKGIIAM
jgi:hypothetical protein